MACLIANTRIKNLYKEVSTEREEVSSLPINLFNDAIGLWQSSKGLDVDTYPSTKSIIKFLEEQGYIEPSGEEKTGVEAKKQEENKAENEPQFFKWKMQATYARDKRKGVTSKTTLEAVKKGERTAITKFVNTSSMKGWESAKVGDIIRFSDGKDEVFVRITKPFTELTEETDPKEWSKKEGWNTARYAHTVLMNIRRGFNPYQAEFEVISREEINDLIKQDVIKETEVKSEEELQVEALTEALLGVNLPATVSAMEKVDKLFDPAERIQRVSLLARKFSEKVDELLEAKRSELQDKIDFAESIYDAAEINRLQTELNALDRLSIIKEKTPGGVFLEIAKSMLDYASKSKEDRIEEELDNLKDISGTEKDKLKIATTLAIRRKRAFEKMAKDAEVFKALAEEAASLLSTTEGIRMDPGYIDSTDVDSSEEDPEDYDEDNRSGSDADKEAATKDGWMVEFRTTSSLDSLSQAVRRIIRQIPRLNHNGKYDIDDIGYLRYLDADYVHTTLNDKLRFMYKPEHMLPLLRQLARTKKWVNLIIDMLEADPDLHAQFYQDFRNDFTNFWVQKKTFDFYGNAKWETIDINKPEGIYYLLERWRDNYEGGFLLTDESKSVYDRESKINKKNASKALKIIDSIQDRLNQVSERADNPVQARLDTLEEEEVWNNIMELLHGIGIDIDEDIVKYALFNIKQEEESPTESEEENLEQTIINLVNTYHTGEVEDSEEPLLTLLEQLNIIYKGIRDGEIEKKSKNAGVESRVDLINTFGSAYNKIALMFAEVTEDAIESSVYENGKSYYSHTVPNFLGKLMKQLRNEMGQFEDYEQMLQEEFKDIDWFFKKDADDPTQGEWRHTWLKLLAENPELRKVIDHKVLLHAGKVGYENWDELEYLQILLREYYSDPHKKTAWYHIPVLSDAKSAEFIKFIKYTEDYKEKILTELVNLVYQELDRIALIYQRDKDYQAGKLYGSPIENYDIIRNEDGSIKSLGGAEFKFLPALNTFQVAAIDSQGNTIVDSEGNPIEEAFIAGLSKRRDLQFTGEQLTDYIKDCLQDVIEQGFEKAFRRWKELGILDTNDIGITKNLPTNYNFREKNRKLLEALQTILGVLSDMEGMENRANIVASMITAIEGRTYESENSINNQIEDLKDFVQGLIDDEYVEEDDIEEVQGALKDLTSVQDLARQDLEEYFWNSMFATSQIIQLTSTDLAFYGNVENYLKRAKAAHSPAKRLDTSHPVYGRKTERTVYLADLKIQSLIVDEIEKLIMSKHAKGDLDDYGAAMILAKFGRYDESKGDYTNEKGQKFTKVGKASVKTDKVNVSDAQALRCLSSMRSVIGMSGQWSEAEARAYDHFKNGTWDAEDFNVIWQTKKPFLYSMVKTLVGYEKKRDENGKLTNEDDTDRPIYARVPTMHKNSEFLILAMLGSEHQKEGNAFTRISPKLAAINQFMEDNNIDVIQFDSAVKVGKQGVVVINDLSDDDYDGVYNRLKESIRDKDNNEDPTVVHEISYDDYGIQQETPEHIVDTLQLIGTQIRKLITADISDDAIIEVDGIKRTKEEWIKQYNAINTANILESFVQVSKIFSDPEQVEKVLQEEIRNNPRYGIEVQRACTLNEDGVFNIPLFDPIQSTLVQQLLNSVIRSRITKQKIRGGSLIQVSSFGYTEELQIVYNEEGNPASGVKYYECYMPAYSKDFFEPLMKEGSYVLDANKLPPELRKLVGYRIPTEDKYSMIPLYIKGFTTQQNGGVIMLPAEITTLTGSDFDIDKLYVMLPEFKVLNPYRIGKAWRDFYKDSENEDIVDEIDENIDTYYREYLANGGDSEVDSQDFLRWLLTPIEEGGLGRKKYNFSEKAQQRFSEWFDSRKEDYKTNPKYLRFGKIKYDYSKSPRENSREARNNLFIDMIWGVLTNPDTVVKMQNPGGFSEHKKASRIALLVNSCTREELITLLRDNGIDIRNNATSEEILKTLNNLDLFRIEEIADTIINATDPLSPMTQLEQHQRVVVSGKMVGIYATHNANHAIVQSQNTGLALDEENGGFTLNGKTLTNLCGVKNAEGQFISRNNAGYLALSVDDLKEQALAYLNQNTFTADATMLLSRLGYTPLEIALFLNQPIVKEMTVAFFRERKNGKSKNRIINDILYKYSNFSKIQSGGSTYEKYPKQKFLIKDLFDNILTYNDKENLSDIDYAVFYGKQLAVGVLFKRILKDADALSDVTQATRADSPGGGAGPDIANTITKIWKVQDLIEKSQGKKYPLKNAALVIENLSNIKDIDRLERAILNSPLPLIQAFYTCGVEATQNMLRPFFPQFNSQFEGIVRILKDESRTGRINKKEVKRIFEELFTYVLSDLPIFGAQEVDGKVYTAEEKRKAYINGFPAYFQQIKNKNSDIAQLGLIQRLKYKNPNKKNPIPTLVFKNVGRLNVTTKARFIRDWATLLHMKNPIAQRLALDLFVYGYFRGGFAFSPQSYMHLAPLALRKAIPGYIERLNSLTDVEDDYTGFVLQYLLNHLDCRTYVPEISNNASVKFTTEKNKLKDEVTFVIKEDKGGNNPEDMKIFKESGTSENSLCYFIAKRVGGIIRGGVAYYILKDTTKQDKDGNHLITYTRVNYLGSPNSFLEYEKGADALSMTSALVIKDRKPSVKDLKKQAGAFNSVSAPKDVTVNGNDVTLDELVANRVSISKEQLEQDFMETVNRNVKWRSFADEFGTSSEEEKENLGKDPNEDDLNINDNEVLTDNQENDSRYSEGLSEDFFKNLQQEQQQALEEAQKMVNGTSSQEIPEEQAFNPFVEIENPTDEQGNPIC